MDEAPASSDRSDRLPDPTTTKPRRTHAAPPPAMLPVRPYPGEAGTPAEGRALPPVPLDPTETSSQTPAGPADDELSSSGWQIEAMPFEHRGWGHDRRRVFASMRRTDRPQSRVQNFARCCENAHVFVEPTTQEVEVRMERCHDRFCVPCGQIRSMKVASAIQRMMDKKACMFITLTLRGRPEDSLAGMIAALQAAWKALRRIAGWRNNIKGGAVMLEVKWSYTSGGHWHPHFHIIAEGNSIDQKWLEHAWFTVSRGSDQVDVQHVKDHAKALSYVVKYASKPVDSSFIRRPHLLDEAMRSLKGQRLCACFGSWHGTPLQEEVENADETEVLTTWVYEGSIRDIEGRARGGDGHAIQLLAAVERQRSLRYALSERCRGVDENSSQPQPPPTD